VVTKTQYANHFQNNYPRDDYSKIGACFVYTVISKILAPTKIGAFFYTQTHTKLHKLDNKNALKVRIK
jgi:hypothetical protein